MDAEFPRADALTERNSVGQLKNIHSQEWLCYKIKTRNPSQLIFDSLRPRVSSSPSFRARRSRPFASFRLNQRYAERLDSRADVCSLCARLHVAFFSMTRPAAATDCHRTRSSSFYSWSTCIGKLRHCRGKSKTPVGCLRYESVFFFKQKTAY